MHRVSLACHTLHVGLLFSLLTVPAALTKDVMETAAPACSPLLSCPGAQGPSALAGLPPVSAALFLDAATYPRAGTVPGKER